MKDVLSLIITIALIFFAVSLTYVQIKNPTMFFGILYIPLIILYILWGEYLYKKY